MTSRHAPYPKGNAQVGDHVWYRRAQKEPWQKDWNVVAVGLPNQHGYPLDVRIRRQSTGQVKVVGPFPSNFEMGKPQQVLIIPQKLPPPLRAILKRYPRLQPYRAGANSEEERFELLCTGCQHWLYIEETMTSELRFGPGGFWQGRPMIEDSGSRVTCSCPEAAYEIDFEHYG